MTRKRSYVESLRHKSTPRKMFHQAEDEEANLVLGNVTSTSPNGLGSCLATIRIGNTMDSIVKFVNKIIMSPKNLKNLMSEINNFMRSRDRHKFKEELFNKKKTASHHCLVSSLLTKPPNIKAPNSLEFAPHSSPYLSVQPSSVS